MRQPNLPSQLTSVEYRIRAALYRHPAKTATTVELGDALLRLTQSFQEPSMLMTCSHNAGGTTIKVFETDE
jgi:hypothetical protein